MLLPGLLALLLYLPAFEWGVLQANRPEVRRGWAVDDEVPLGTLAELTGIREQRPDRNLGYPLMHPLMLGTAFAPYLVWLRATDRFVPAGEEYPYGLADAEASLRVLGLIGHLMSVLAAVGVVMAAAYAGGQLGGGAAAVLAGVLSSLMFPMFYYARTGNVDVPALLFLAIALAGFARVLVHGFTRRNSWVLGLACGFAVATKEPSLAFLLPIPLVLVPVHVVRAMRGQRPRIAAAVGLPLLCLAVALLAFGLGSGLFIDPERYLAHVRFVQERLGEVAEGTVAFVSSHPATLAGHAALARRIAGHLVDSVTAPGLLLGLAGVAVSLRRPAQAAVALPAVSYLFVLFWASRTSMLRYVLPGALVIAVFAGVGLAAAARSRRSWLRVPGLATGVLAIGLGLGRGVDLTYEMLNDSRYAAAEWLAGAIGPGERIEFFDAEQKMPRVPAGVRVERAREYRGAIHAADTSEERAQEIRLRWSVTKPKFIFVIPDHSSPPGAPYSIGCPPVIFRELGDGSLGYELTMLFRQARLFPRLPRPALDYPTVNPPIRVYGRTPGRGT